MKNSNYGIKYLFVPIVAGLIVLGIFSCKQSSQQSTGGGNDTTSSPSIPLKTQPRIYDIQGTSHESPYKDKKVTDVEGIVTAVTYGKNKQKQIIPKGFYMQDAAGDGNKATSDGIYVYCAGHPQLAALAKGDLVAVTGTVTEFAYKPKNKEIIDLPVTQITVKTTDTITVKEHNKPLPAPIAVTAQDISGKPVFVSKLEELAPDAEVLDFYESLEGMRVTVAAPKVVAAPYMSTYYIVPGGADLTSRGGVIYNSYKSTARVCMTPFNCFKQGKTDTGLNFAEVTLGDSYTGDITGIMSYGYTNYRIEVSEPLPTANVHTFTAETSSISHNANKLNVVSYNLENFSKYEETAKKHKHKSGKTSEERAAAFADHLVTQLKSPDLICLIEIQDDDGSKKNKTTSKETLKLLITKIKGISGAPTYEACWIDPAKDTDGGKPGTNIRCAYLYRTDRLELVADADGTPTDSAVSSAKAEITADGSKLTANPARIGVENEAFTNTRKSLVGHFKLKTGTLANKDFFVINNHFSSKRGDDPIWGKTQPAQRKSEENRYKQAQAVRSFIDSIFAARNDAAVISVGDYNDYWFSKTLDIIKGADMKNAVEALPENDRYTYVYDGHSQTLDNIVVSNHVTVDIVDVLHINSEQSAKTRLSDHDPVFVQLSW